jgi:hypothetical protein
VTEQIKKIEFVHINIVSYHQDAIDLNRIEYNSFGNDYVKCGFCEKTGGYWVYHVDHIFDPVRGYYEKDAAAILHANGYKVILESERNKGRNQKYSDGTLNNCVFEIQSVDGDGKNNIKGHFNNCFKKKVSIVVLYYPKPELFDSDKLQKGYKKYIRLPRSIPLKVIYIVNGSVFKYK